MEDKKLGKYIEKGLGVMQINIILFSHSSLKMGGETIFHSFLSSWIGRYFGKTNQKIMSTG